MNKMRMVKKSQNEWYVCHTLDHTLLGAKEAKDSCYALSLPRLLSAAGAGTQAVAPMFGSVVPMLCLHLCGTKMLLVIVPSLKN